MPFGFQIVAELMELGGVFARQHDGAGAETVTEGVHAARSFTLGSLGASRFLRVASIGLELFERCHRAILTNRAKIGVIYYYFSFISAKFSTSTPTIAPLASELDKNSV